MEIHILTSKDLLTFSNEHISACKKLIDKRFWVCLKGEDPWGVRDSKIFGAVVYDNGNIPVGVAFTTYRKYLAWATLLTLPLNLSENVIELVLQKFKEKLLQENCHIFSFIYSEKLSRESLFTRTGWSSPRLFMIRYYFTHEHYPPWLKQFQESHLPKGFTIFPWKEITSTEEQQLHFQLDQNIIPQVVSPFHQIETIEPLNSLGVRYQGKVIGWIITNRTDPDTICYSSLYVAPEFRNTIIPIILITQSITLQLNSSVPKGSVDFNLAQIDHKWITFIKKRFAPYAESTERFYEVVNYLQTIQDLDF